MPISVPTRAQISEQIPVIDLADFPTGASALAASGHSHRALARDIHSACRQHGFFYVVGHGVERALIARLERLSRVFFARPEADKLAISMDRGGRAWRGYFPVGHELTSGRPDRKEGLYLGAELAADDSRVVAGVPLHGRNLFPADLPGFRDTVLATLDALSFDAHVRAIDPGAEFLDDADERWDRRSVHAFEGTYGEYLLAKVARVFPELRAAHLEAATTARG